MEISAAATTVPVRPGKSAQSVGHLAKAAVAEAKASGLDVPKNAQGVAASSIAGGADPSSVFAALVAPDTDATGDGAQDGDEISPAPADGELTEGISPDDGQETVTAPEAAEAYSSAIAAFTDDASNSMETALELLSGAG